MAETVVINIEANTQGLQSTIDLLTKLGVVEQKVADEFRKTNEQNVTSLNKGVQATTKEFEKLDKAVKGIKADNQLAKGLDASKEVAKTGNSFNSLRKQFQAATKEVEELTGKFGPLDARTKAAAIKAGELASEIDNINKQINALTPEGKFQAIQNLGGSIAGIFQVATGALQAFGVESEQATKIAQQFQGALNIFGGLSQLTQLKDNLTAVKAALGFTTAAQVTNTTATEAGIVATEGQVVANNAATFSFQALTAAMKANPFGAVLIAITALIGGFTLLNNLLDDSEEKFQNINDEIASADRLLSAQTQTIDRNGKKQLSDLDLVIQRKQDQIALDAGLAKTASEKIAIEERGNKELFELQKERLSLESRILQRKVDANTESLNKDIAARNKAKELNTEESKELVKNLDERIEAKRQFNDNSITESQILFNELQTLESNFTKDVKLQQKARSEADFEQTLTNWKRYYTQLRTIALNTSKDTQEFNRTSTKLAIEETEKTIELYKKQNKDVTDLEFQLAQLRIKANDEAFENELANAKKREQENKRSLSQISSSEEEFNNRLKSQRSLVLSELIEIYKKYNKDIGDLQAELDALLLSERKSPAQKNAQDYTNAIGIITQYYSEEELRILKNAKTKEEADLLIKKNELDKLNTLREAAVKFGQDTTEIDKNIVKLTNDSTEAVENLSKQVLEGLRDLGVQIFFDQINKGFEDSIETVNALKEAQLEAIAEEEEALLESYDNRRIGKREFEFEQERLARQRINAEKKAEKELNEIRRKQDIANRAQKLFEIGIATFRNVVEQPGAGGVLIPFWIGLGAIQAAGVLAQPLPKYKKGTLSVGGVGTDDSQLALLQPGEAVIPTDTNRRYHPAIKAIYHGKIKADDINNFVNLKLRGDYSPADTRPVTAKMDTSDLYALGRIMKKNDGVYVRNIGELAALITDSYNPRR